MTSPTPRKKTGRPSKGNRHVMTARMDAGDAQKLFKIAASMGIPASDLIARTMHEYLTNVDLEAIEIQEALPIAKAS